MPELVGYHVAPCAYREGIRKCGLVPKVKPRNHSWLKNRRGVYFFTQLKEALVWADRYNRQMRGPVDIWRLVIPAGVEVHEDSYRWDVGESAGFVTEPVPTVKLLRREVG